MNHIEELIDMILKLSVTEETKETLILKLGYADGQSRKEAQWEVVKKLQELYSYQDIIL